VTLSIAVINSVVGGALCVCDLFGLFVALGSSTQAAKMMAATSTIWLSFTIEVIPW